MIDFGFERHDRGFEGETFELEFYNKLAPLEWSLLRTPDIDFPYGVAFDLYDVVPRLNYVYSVSSNCLSLFSLCAIINYIYKIHILIYNYSFTKLVHPI